MYEDEFELTFQVPEEESAPEPLAAPAAEPAAPVEPVVDEPTRIMTLGKTAAPAVDEPTRVITLEKPAEPPAVELPEAPAPQPVKERPAPAAPAAARRVLISGGDRGIGAAAARAFAAAGYQVAVLYHQNAAAAAALEQQLPGCIAIQCDVASRASCELAFHAVEQALGRVDVLVNNAGITRDNLILRLTEQDFDAVLDTNLKSAFLCCKEAARRMVRQRYGRIVNLSSVVALRGNAGQTNYAASKAGLIGLTKSLARELAARNVTVNAVAPGFIDTDMTAVLPEAVRTGMTQGIPAGRAGQPEDVAQAVAFFAAEQSSYLTGQVLCVDGGMAM